MFSYQSNQILEGMMELNQEDFEAMLAAATSPSQISKYFARGCEWNFDSTEERDVAIVKAAERAVELVTTVEQGISLFQSFGPVDGIVSRKQDNELFNKMVDLIKTEEELDSMYHELAMLEDEIKRRNLIRRIFDKADELGIETI